MVHDHSLELTGIWDGIAMWELHCNHGFSERQFYEYEFEGIKYAQDECLVQDWWDEAGLDMISVAPRVGEFVPLWTGWFEDGAPLLMGRKRYEDWKEMQE